MPFVAVSPSSYQLIQRSPALIRGCILGPTLLLGLLFAAGAARGLLRFAHLVGGPRPNTTSTALGE